MNRQIQNMILAITFMAGLAVAYCTPSPYDQNADVATTTTPTVSTEIAVDAAERSLPDLTVIEVDVHRLAYTRTLA